MAQFEDLKSNMKIVQEEETQAKSNVNRYLIDKRNEIDLLRAEEVKFQQLSSYFGKTSEPNLFIEKSIQEMNMEYIASEMTVSHWQTKCDCAHTSLESATKADEAKKQVIQELESELKAMSDELSKARDAIESDGRIELSNSQVSIN